MTVDSIPPFLKGEAKCPSPDLMAVKPVALGTRYGGNKLILTEEDAESIKKSLRSLCILCDPLMPN